LRRPNPILLLAALLAAAAGAGSAVAQSGPSTIEAFTVSGGALTPPASCSGTSTVTCTIQHQVRGNPIPRGGSVAYVDADTHERLTGTFAVRYNLYSFTGEIVLSTGADGQPVLERAEGAGSAAAAWSMTFSDGSTLYGDFLAPGIEMTRVGAGSTAAMRLVVDFAVDVAGGTGRFAGQTGACGTSRCRFFMTTTTSARALAGKAAIKRSSLKVRLRKAPARALIALQGNALLTPTDPRSLQVSVAEGSTCEAAAVPTGGAARAAQAPNRVDLGRVRAAKGNVAEYADWLEQLRLERTGLGRAAQAGGDQAWRVDVKCTKPATPALRVSREFRMRAEE
jgi:hypothetical protein